MDRKTRKSLPSKGEILELIQIIKSNNFILMASLADVVDRYIDKTFSEDEISRLTHSALNIIVARGGSITPTELADLMHRTKHSITKVIDSLEKADLVVRDRTDVDRRVTHVLATSAALKLMRETFKPDKVRETMSALTAEEEETFRKLALKLRKRIIQVIRNEVPLKVPPLTEPK